MSKGSDSSDLLTSLERMLILRRFNLEHLGMEYSTTESDMSKIIGVGQRLHQPTGDIRPVVDFYYSYFRRMSATFEHTPVAETFGLSIAEAMALPVNRWYAIEKQARLLADRPKKDDMSDMLEVLKELVKAFTVTQS